MYDVPIFLINLDDSPDRLAAATLAAASQSEKFQRISGYNGRNIKPNDIPEYDPVATDKYLGRGLNGGEIGCFFSHIQAVQAFVETGAPYGLVLEDDMHPLSAAFAMTGELINWQMKRGKPDWYVANLGAKRMKIMTPVGEISAQGIESTIYRGHYFPMLATALLWTREGAIEFLENCLPMDCPLDNYTRRWLTENDMGLTLDPPLFSTTGAASDIDTSHTAKRRGIYGRSKHYGWRKIKRMYTDKFRALRHKVKRSRQKTEIH